MNKEPYFYKTKDEKEHSVTWAHSMKEAIKTVRLNTLKKEGIYKIWCFHKDGQISKPRFFRKK